MENWRLPLRRRTFQSFPIKTNSSLQHASHRFASTITPSKVTRGKAPCVPTREGVLPAAPASPLEPPPPRPLRRHPACPGALPPPCPGGPGSRPPPRPESPVAVPRDPTALPHWNPSEPPGARARGRTGGRVPLHSRGPPPKSGRPRRGTTSGAYPSNPPKPPRGSSISSVSAGAGARALRRFRAARADGVRARERAQWTRSGRAWARLAQTLAGPQRSRRGCASRAGVGGRGGPRAAGVAGRAAPSAGRRGRGEVAGVAAGAGRGGGGGGEGGPQASSAPDPANYPRPRGGASGWRGGARAPAQEDV